MSDSAHQPQSEPAFPSVSENAVIKAQANNPLGRNQYGSMIDKDLLHAALKKLVYTENVTQRATLLVRLDIEYGMKMSKSTLSRYMTKFRIGGCRLQAVDQDHATSLIVSHILAHDPLMRAGPDKVRHQISLRHGIHLSRAMTRSIMHAHWDEAFDDRSPKKSRNLSHTALVSSLSPQEQISPETS